MFLNYSQVYKWLYTARMTQFQEADVFSFIATQRFNQFILKYENETLSPVSLIPKDYPPGRVLRETGRKLYPQSILTSYIGSSNFFFIHSSEAADNNYVNYLIIIP